MSNRVEISNGALNLVGQQVVIAALTDNSVSARLCNLNCDMSIRETLRLGRWKSARARANLVQTVVPAFGWAYAYILPQDYLRMCFYNEVNVDAMVQPLFAIEGKLLLSQDSTASIIYVKDLTNPLNDVNVQDALLNNLFILRLAIKLCWPLQQEQSLRVALEQKFQIDLRVAKSVDGQEGREPLQNDLLDSSWISGRYCGTGA